MCSQSVSLPVQIQLLSNLIFWLKGYANINPRPLPGFRMNLESPTHQACTFSHASDAQTHSISHLLRIESTPIVAHEKKQSVPGLAQIHLAL
jgi:hypothetical protein